MGKYYLYQHAGSKNHGCEALVRTIVKTIRIIDNKSTITLVSSNPAEEDEYNLGSGLKINVIGLNKHIQKGNLQWLKLQTAKAFHNKQAQLKLTYNLHWIEEGATYIAIGGDNYCYNKGRLFYDVDNCITGRKILWGCSIEPQDLDPELISHLHGFQWIIARETITYNALIENGFNNILLAPDTAFMLESKKVAIAGEYIGINLSPLVMNYVDNSEIIYNNYTKLIEYIIQTTRYSILFIPHVVAAGNDDRTAIIQLINRIDIPKERYTVLKDMSCIDIKGYIGRCSFFIGARTHATIAAYSLKIPTLVLGYSVKSKGIAKDIFGTWDKFVVPVSELADDNQLLDCFKNIQLEKEAIMQMETKYMANIVDRIQQTYSMALRGER